MARGGGFPRGGGGNMNQMIKQAQKMQQEMLKTQQELEEQDVETTAGGGAVTVVMSGKKRLTKVEIDPDLLDPEDVEMLQDLILVAVNDALTKVEDAAAKEMSKFTGGMNMPGLF